MKSQSIKKWLPNYMTSRNHKITRPLKRGLVDHIYNS